MALEFHELKVQDIIRRTSDCVSVVFDVSNGIKDKYQYQAGQYLTLETTISGEEVRRSYSLCTSPSDEKLEVAIKKVPHGKFSTFANEDLNVGDTIRVGSPEGRFLLKKESGDRDTYVFLQQVAV